MAELPTIARLEARLDEGDRLMAEVRDAIRESRAESKKTRLAIDGLHEAIGENRQVILGNTSAFNSMRDSLRGFAGVVGELREAVAEHRTTTASFQAEVRSLGEDVRSFGGAVRSLDANVQELGPMIADVNGNVQAVRGGVFTMFDRLDHVVDLLERRVDDDPPPAQSP